MWTASATIYKVVVFFIIRYRPGIDTGQGIDTGPGIYMDANSWA